MISLPAEALESAVARVFPEVQAHHVPLGRSTSEELLWRELVACILGSQVRYESCLTALRHLGSHGLLNVPLSIKSPFLLERLIEQGLKYCSCKVSPPCPQYRFPRLRANHLRRTIENIYLQGNTLRRVLASADSEIQARDLLTAYAVGLGPKQASLFLRNTGFADNLAILDRHVLNYMAILGLLRKPISHIRSVAEYEEVEARLQDYALTFSISVGVLDTAIWVVMRVASEY